jgi:hypothetical protein
MAGACKGCNGNGSAFNPCEVCGAGLGENAPAGAVTEDVQVAEPNEETPEPAEAPVEDEDPAEVKADQTGYDSLLPSDDVS